MSQPSQMIIDTLKAVEGDSETYHSIFDELLETKLKELDHEWMSKMNELYDKSGCSRWYA